MWVIRNRPGFGRVRRAAAQPIVVETAPLVPVRRDRLGLSREQTARIDSVLAHPRDVREHAEQLAQETPTDQELELLALMAEGFTYEEIGRQMCLAADSVKQIARRLMTRLGAKNQSQLVGNGFRRGYLI